MRCCTTVVFFHILHETLYRYDTPVQLGSHWLRLTPQTRSLLRRSSSLHVEPTPVTLDRATDNFGNEVARVTFLGETRRLYVRSEQELETEVPSPIAPPLLQLPWLAPAGDAAFQVNLEAPHESVRDFSAALVRNVGGDPIRFLDALCSELFRSCDRHVRPTGQARKAHETLALRSGACRDLTVLFLEVCRIQGIVGRFASGYQAALDTPDGRRHLHAWAEVFVPGVGFRGWDPMHGVRVGDGHVLLCAAPDPAATLPVEGGFSFSGSVVNTTLDHCVRINTQGRLTGFNELAHL
jgi:transglutaminase-like putative cysteine protease